MEVIDEVPSLDLGATLDSLIRESPTIHHADPAKLKTSKTKKDSNVCGTKPHKLIALEQEPKKFKPIKRPAPERVVSLPSSSSSCSSAIPVRIR